LAGIYKETSGRLLIDGQPVFENEGIKSQIVFIPDLLYYFPNYTILDMARFYAHIYPQWNEARFFELAGVFGIELKRRVKTLSKGMQRQVAFWLGLALMPDLMILDEPLDGLDPVMRQKVKQLIFQDVAERQMTVIVSSHILLTSLQESAHFTKGYFDAWEPYPCVNQHTVDTREPSLCVTSPFVKSINRHTVDTKEPSPCVNFPFWAPIPGRHYPWWAPRT
jgi:ABC-type Mn2+/Zn2+ transport system ATPase subunit